MRIASSTTRYGPQAELPRISLIPPKQVNRVRNPHPKALALHELQVNMLVVRVFVTFERQRAIIRSKPYCGPGKRRVLDLEVEGVVEPYALEDLGLTPCDSWTNEQRWGGNRLEADS